MTREKKSAPGWRKTKIGDISASPFSSETLQKLVALLPLLDDADIESLRRELQDWARLYLVAKANFDCAPRPASQRAALKKLRDEFASAGEALQALDDESRDRLNLPPTAIDDDTTSSPLTLDQIQRFIAQIDKSLGAIEVSGARKGARALFLLGLAEVWVKFTGQRPTRRHDPYAPPAEREYGPFRQFALAALEALDPQEAEHGLDDDIRDVVRAARRMG